MGPRKKIQNVPIAAQCNDHSAYLAGVPYQKFYTDARTFAEVQLLVSEYYGFDAPNTMWDIYNIEAEALGQKMSYSPKGMPDVDFTSPIIKEPSILDDLKPPDPFKSGRMPWVHQLNKIYMEKTGRPAHGFFCAPFSLAVNIRGYVNFIRDIKTDPAYAHRLLEFICDEVLSPYIKAMRQETGIENMLADGMDAWASPPNVDLDIVDNFVLPYIERLRGTLGERVVTGGQWGEEKSHDPERFMLQKLKACPITLRISDPSLHVLGPHRVKEFAQRHKVRVTAGLDAGLLMDGPIDLIIERIRFYIDVLGREENLFIYLNQIPATTPPAHIHAAVAACRTFGKYPIAENFDEVALDLAERETFAEFAAAKGVSYAV
ncbi:MAG: uroporphyrinogen decarboxylase family protein [Desulfarculaceae bacterium]|jgi:uroporphyrinogen-III decarboxylase